MTSEDGRYRLPAAYVRIVCGVQYVQILVGCVSRSTALGLQTQKWESFQRACKGLLYPVLENVGVDVASLALSIKESSPIFVLGA